MTAHQPTATAALTASAPAKINLYLELLARRPDGFHDLETLMVAVNCTDTLTFMPTDDGSLSLTCTDPALDCGPSNLVVRAAQLLRHQSGCSAGAAIHLTKRIPVQGGLGGGSSDAATTLTGLNRLWQLGLTVVQLSAMAALLGSDVAFFVRGGAAWCTGRGEIVEPVTLPTPVHAVLVCPPFGTPTPAVFRAVRVPETPRDGRAIRTASDTETLAAAVFNRLEEPALRVSPGLSNYLDALRASGALAATVSGSGSTLFGLCRDAMHAEQVVDEVTTRVPDARVFAVQSVNG